MWFKWFYLLEWLVRLGMVLLVVRRNRPAVAVSWLMVIFLYPWLGIPLYWLFGSTRVSRRREKLLKRMENHLKRLRSRLDDGACESLPASGKVLGRLVERLGAFAPEGGNAVEFLVDTEAYVERLVADIDAAEVSVGLLYYIFVDDEIGERVLVALQAAARRGVHCRLLVDAIQSRRFLRRWSRELGRQGVEVRAALPMKLFGRLRRRVDTRNHRKLAVIDGRVGYVGSHNIAEPHYGSKTMLWRDVSTRLTGPAVLQAQALFLSDWCAEVDELPKLDQLFPPSEPVGASVVQLLPSGPIYAHENYQRLLVAAIHNAKHRVVITTPYFVPDDSLLQALETACLRGVKIILVLPERTDQWLVGFAARSYYQEIIGYGVRLHLHRDGLLHAKTVTVDGQLGLAGSSNLDIRSFSLNFEANLVLHSPADIALLAKLQAGYLGKARRLTGPQWRRRPRLLRLLENLVRLLSPLL